MTTPLLGCLPPVCMLLASLVLVGMVLLTAGAVKDVPPDPTAPPPEPSTFPGLWVTLLIATGVALVMWALSEIAAPG